MAEIKEMGVFDFSDYNKEQFVGETIIANKVTEELTKILELSPTDML